MRSATSARGIVGQYGDDLVALDLLAVLDAQFDQGGATAGSPATTAVPSGASV